MLRLDRLCGWLLAVSLSGLGCDDDEPDALSQAGGAAQGGGASGSAGDIGNAGGAGGLAGGSGGQAGGGGAGGPVGPPEPAQLLFPTGRALTEKALVPACAAGPCHNGTWAAPALTSYDALLALVRGPCQTGAGNPAIVSNECEPPGDKLAFADKTERTILAVVVPPKEPTVPSRVAVFLDGEPGQGELRWLHAGSPARPLPGVTLAPLEGGAWLLDLSGLPGALADAWDVRDWPRPPGAVQEADPNGDGVLGASLGWRQVLPGEPGRSYLYQRLLSDRLGTRMPLVASSAWPSEANRAMFCWIFGLNNPGATAADAPIDYATCPPDLDVTSGFEAVASISKNKCAIPSCHGGDAPAAGLDLSPTKAAFSKLLGAESIQVEGAPLLTPGKPAESYFYCKIDPDCERASGTALMPKGLGQLSPKELARIREWIEQGAKLD